jgi:hypothetical protein
VAALDPEFERMLVGRASSCSSTGSRCPTPSRRPASSPRGRSAQALEAEPDGLQVAEKWVEFSKAKDEMFSYTDIREAPWYTIEADDKKRAG